MCRFKFIKLILVSIFMLSLPIYVTHLYVTHSEDDLNNPKIVKAENLYKQAEEFMRSHQYQKALEYYEQSLVIRREIKDRQGEAVTLNNLGITYSSLGRDDESLRFLTFPPRKLDQSKVEESGKIT